MAGMANTGCTHQLDYLLKEHDSSYIGSVVQIPGIIVQGKTPEEITNKIRPATIHYFKHDEEVHKRAQKNKLKPELVTSTTGIIIKTVPFKITC